MRAAEGVDVGAKEGKGDIFPSGEWAENFSLLNYEDLSKHYEPVLFKPEVCIYSVGVRVLAVLKRNPLLIQI